MAMCNRRLEQTTVSFDTAEDYYNYGVALINTRKLTEARTHLEKALEIAPESDHIHYALALAQALAGDFAGAYENLKRAIELEPRNRLIARQDADFAPLANQRRIPFPALSRKEGVVAVAIGPRLASDGRPSPLRVVAIGGGTGLSALLQGLKQYTRPSGGAGTPRWTSRRSSR